MGGKQTNLYLWIIICLRIILNILMDLRVFFFDFLLLIFFLQEHDVIGSSKDSSDTSWSAVSIGCCSLDSGIGCCCGGSCAECCCCSCVIGTTGTSSTAGDDCICCWCCWHSSTFIAIMRCCCGFIRWWCEMKPFEAMDDVAADQLMML